MPKGKNKKSNSAKKSTRKSNPAEEVSAAAQALRDQESRKRKKSSKSKDSPAAEVPTDDSPPAADANNDAPFKLLTELNSDEAKKECVKLKLIEAGAKVRKDFCQIKISEFLGSRGLSSTTFKFTPNGLTEFPSVLFEKAPTDSNAASDESEEDDSGDSEDSQSESEDDDDAPRVVSPSKKRVSFQTHKSSSRRRHNAAQVFGGGSVPSGWYVMPHPRTGEPVGMLRESDGKLLELRDPSSSNNIPTETSCPNVNRVDNNVNTRRQISQAASMLGATQPPARDNSFSQSSHAGSNWIKSMQNVEFCNSNIPSFVHSQEKDSNNSSKKLVSGMYTTGKKEVLQKEVYPHHMVDSLINPEGVEYHDMNMQELNNGFTAMILAKCDENTPPAVTNMLKHLNRLNAYLMFAPLPTVLEFNGGFMKGLENRTQSWENGSKMMEYHDRHLHSLKLSSNKVEPNSKKNDKNSSDKDENPKQGAQKQKCTKEWVLKKGMCFNYQNDQCDQQNGHDDGNGKAQVHSCAWCSYCDRGYLLHNNITCEDKKNPFRKARHQSGQ